MNSLIFPKSHSFKEHMKAITWTKKSQRVFLFRRKITRDRISSFDLLRPFSPCSLVQTRLQVFSRNSWDQDYLRQSQIPLFVSYNLFPGLKEHVKVPTCRSTIQNIQIPKLTVSVIQKHRTQKLMSQLESWRAWPIEYMTNSYFSKSARQMAWWR